MDIKVAVCGHSKTAGLGNCGAKHFFQAKINQLFYRWQHGNNSFKLSSFVEMPNFIVQFHELFWTETLTVSFTKLKSRIDTRYVIINNSKS